MSNEINHAFVIVQGIITSPFLHPFIISSMGVSSGYSSSMYSNSNSSFYSIILC